MAKCSKALKFICPTLHASWVPHLPHLPLLLLFNNSAQSEQGLKEGEKGKGVERKAFPELLFLYSAYTRPSYFACGKVDGLPSLPSIPQSREGKTKTCYCQVTTTEAKNSPKKCQKNVCLQQNAMGKKLIITKCIVKNLF